MWSLLRRLMQLLTRAGFLDWIVDLPSREVLAPLPCGRTVAGALRRGFSPSPSRSGACHLPDGAWSTFVVPGLRAPSTVEILAAGRGFACRAWLDVGSRSRPPPRQVQLANFCSVTTLNTTVIKIPITMTDLLRNVAVISKLHLVIHRGKAKTAIRWAAHLVAILTTGTTASANSSQAGCRPVALGAGARKKAPLLLSSCRARYGAVITVSPC